MGSHMHPAHLPSWTTVRLVRSGPGDAPAVIDASMILPANPPTVTINVLNELLVGNVTSRPLTLDEIRQHGIEFDATSFQAFMFTVAFTMSSSVVPISLPVRDPPFHPGESEFDNPLRVARTAAGRENVKAVLAPGPDGQSGTADDVDRLAPQGMGTAEFLVEGVREGSHVMEVEIRGILEGLPSGPAEVMGKARGSVVVRDPNFALTFIHPDVVRAGERYELLV